ncbi:MAG: hypothetical protein JKX94_10165 [Sneathiella sp.]|nr:hypothetical protein [Sneathiella sp.]
MEDNKKEKIKYNPWKMGVLICLGLMSVFALYLSMRFMTDSVDYQVTEEDHFKYGSTGGERLAGIPVGIWNALPGLCRRHLPKGDFAHGYEAFGFIYEKGKDYPVGSSIRRHAGLDRVFLNCATCHAGLVRTSSEADPMLVLGMPSNTVDLQAFQSFMFNCVTDERFNPIDIITEAEAAGADYDLIDKITIGVVVAPLVKDLLLLLRDRFSYMAELPRFGPGRYDTFGPAKVLMNWDMSKIPPAEQVGVVDYPSIWNHSKRLGMQLHWDGNNISVEERNRSASFGTWAMPVTLDRQSIKRIENWIWDKAQPPKYPLPINLELSKKGAVIYQALCRDCHGENGQDFTGKFVGEVVPIKQIGTDRNRLDSYTYDLAVNQNTLYAGFEKDRFKHFRKTWGYANMPLDGLWLRAPYLHNGSVPTLRDLLSPAAERPQIFYRGHTVLDSKDLGFVHTKPTEKGRILFRIDTRVRGNGNSGHEGFIYGTELSEPDKAALIEYLKTF